MISLSNEMILPPILTLSLNSYAAENAEKLPLFPKITTEIQNFKNFYYAEEYHQQYLLKNPNGYCGIGGCNVSYNNWPWPKRIIIILNELRILWK